MGEILRVLQMNYRSNNDRVGAHCLHYICIFVLAHFNNMPIHVDISKRLYVDDIFMSSLYNYCDKHNSRFIDKLNNATKTESISVYELLKMPSNEINCNLTYIYKIVQMINSDIYSYYKINIMEDVLDIFNKKTKNLNMKPSKDTLILHLRLDDCQNFTYDYNSDGIVKFFNDYITYLPNVNNLTTRFINYSKKNNTEIFQKYKYIKNINHIIHNVKNIIDSNEDTIINYLKENIGINWKEVLIYSNNDDIPIKEFILKYTHMELERNTELETNTVVDYSKPSEFLMPLQSIINENRLQKLIREININNIEIVTSIKESKIDLLPYKIISNSFREDLYYLSNAKKLICSRSTFSLTSLFFNQNIENVWIPNWGISLSLGFNTKYDKTSFKYF